MPIKLLIIILAVLSFTNLIAQTPCNPDSSKHASAFMEDTTIVLPNGTTMTFNRCEFFDIKDCIEFDEILTVADMKRRGFQTLDNEGNVLLTCGMTYFNFHSADCDRVHTCLDVPVKVKIPMLANPCISTPGNNRLYKIDSTGRWGLDGSSQEITENGVKYFVFEASCSGGFNCDKKLFSTIVKFKARGIKKLKSLNVSNNCPLLNMNFVAKRRKNIIYAEIPCLNPDSLIISVKGIDKSGEFVNLSKPLNRLRSKYTKSKFGTISNKVVRSVLGIFKFRERNVYGKYILE
jgi:hypothetical protein